jgi:hypothetical protein
MALRNMLRECVTLVKQDGRRFEGVRASVQSGQIFTDDPKLPIEEGDRFERNLPSGLLERFVITETGFMEGTGGIPPHYQSKVRKLTNTYRDERSPTPILKLFVSHSSRDVGIVTLLVDLLRSALKLSATEIRCTSIDGYRLPGGADTLNQLRREVHDAQAFVGVISTASIESMYVMFELGARWGAGKHLLPVLAPGTSPHILSGPLAGINALVCDNRAQLHQLVDDLARQISAQPDRGCHSKTDRCRFAVSCRFRGPLLRDQLARVHCNAARCP